MQTLSKIKINEIVFENNFAQIFISERIKTSALNRNQPVLKIPRFDEQKSLCVFTLLKFYIEKTSDIRKNEKYLFLTHKKPFHKATTQTISRWIKETLTQSGIDTKIFKSHSTRHASTSAASRSGINIETIRKTAAWTEGSGVFARFYNRPVIENCTFAKSILNLHKC